MILDVTEDMYRATNQHARSLMKEFVSNECDFGDVRNVAHETLPFDPFYDGEKGWQNIGFTDVVLDSSLNDKLADFAKRMHFDLRAGSYEEMELHLCLRFPIPSDEEKAYQYCVYLHRKYDYYMSFSDQVWINHRSGCRAEYIMDASIIARQRLYVMNEPVENLECIKDLANRAYRNLFKVYSSVVSIPFLDGVNRITPNYFEDAGFDLETKGIFDKNIAYELERKWFEDMKCVEGWAKSDE